MDYLLKLRFSFHSLIRAYGLDVCAKSRQYQTDQTDWLCAPKSYNMRRLECRLRILSLAVASYTITDRESLRFWIWCILQNRFLQKLWWASHSKNNSHYDNSDNDSNHSYYNNSFSSIVPFRLSFQTFCCLLKLVSLQKRGWILKTLPCWQTTTKINRVHVPFDMLKGKTKIR